VSNSLVRYYSYQVQACNARPRRFVWTPSLISSSFRSTPPSLGLLRTAHTGVKLSIFSPSLPRRTSAVVGSNFLVLAEGLSDQMDGTDLATWLSGSGMERRLTRVTSHS